MAAPLNTAQVDALTPWVASYRKLLAVAEDIGHTLVAADLRAARRDLATIAETVGATRYQVAALLSQG